MTVVMAATQHNVALTLHQGFANAVLIYTIILALWGFFLYLRGSGPSGGYLGALVILEGLGLLQGLIGLILLLQGHRPADALHYLYGAVLVLTLPTAYFYGDNGTTRRDSLIFSLATLFLAGIAIRAIATGGT